MPPKFTKLGKDEVLVKALVEKFERAEELSRKKEKIELKKKIKQAPRKKEADGIRKKMEFEDKYKVKLKEFVEKDF